MVSFTEKKTTAERAVNKEKTDNQNGKSEFVRPPLDLIQDIKDGMNYILFNPNAALLVGPLLLFLESAALKIIVKNVPYTEIDYQAYMQQIEMIQHQHNLNYSEIRGDTGPLVYPAGHVAIYRLMYRITNGVSSINNGQVCFRYLYLMTLVLQFICYDMLQISPWCMLLACFSKRLHSIYVLRLFNDCFTTFFIVLTVTLLLFVNKLNNSSRKSRLIVLMLASLSYSIAVSIKMNALLYLPGIIVSIFILSDNSILLSLLNGAIMIIWQIFIALPFLKTYPLEYFHGAFNFKRQFMYKWSINWQFLGEETFQNTLFQKSLLVSQFMLILTVILMIYPSFFQDIFKSILLRKKENITKRDNTSAIAFLLIMSNFIGILFSRSLHYQFLSWYHWTIPILMFWSKLPIYVGPFWYLLHEYCWNSYPPNSRASLILFICNCTMIGLIFLKYEPQNIQVETIKDKKEN